jgi:hypothetical protein
MRAENGEQERAFVALSGLFFLLLDDGAGLAVVTGGLQHGTEVLQRHERARLLVPDQHLSV